MLDAQPRILENETQKIRWDFYKVTDHLITTRPIDSYKKKEDSGLLRSRWPKLKLKESEEGDKYRELARELNKLCNRKVILKLIVIVALGTVTKGLIQGLGDLEIKV